VEGWERFGAGLEDLPPRPAGEAGRFFVAQRIAFTWSIDRASDGFALNKRPQLPGAGSTFGSGGPIHGVRIERSLWSARVRSPETQET